MTQSNPPVINRRRGKQLEAEILDNAWKELVDTGFAKLTMESVATRAQTSAAVLYRRWPNKGELVLAALAHYRDSHPIEMADTGALRGDLLAQLASVGETLSEFFAIAVATSISGMLADTGLTLAQAREKVMSAQALPRTRHLYQRAHDRGEIDLGAIPAAILDMPFDMLRHDLIMNAKPPTSARIRSIVDELFLPLARNYPGTSRADSPPIRQFKAPRRAT